MRWILGLICGLSLSSAAFSDDWDVSRARTVFAFAESQEVTEGPEKPKSDKCPDCYGTGKRGDGRVTIICPTCAGTGKRQSGITSPVSGAVGPSADVSEGKADSEVYGLRYTAEWCGYCKEFDKLHAPALAINFEVIDVTDTPDVAKAAGVTGLPAFVICDRDLETVLARTQGLHTAESINQLIEDSRSLKRQRKIANEYSAPRSTVRIQAANNASENFGTGTIIRFSQDRSSALVLTCAHVVDGLTGDLVLEAVQQGGRKLSGKLLKVDKNVDLAVIQVQNDGSWQTGNDENIGTCIVRGTKAVAYGYPSGGSLCTLSTEIIGSASGEKIQGQDFVLFASDPSHGMSGGGLFVDGTLVGVVSMADRQKKFGFAVRSKEIREFLKGI